MLIPLSKAVVARCPVQGLRAIVPEDKSCCLFRNTMPCGCAADNGGTHVADVIQFHDACLSGVAFRLLPETSLSVPTPRSVKPG